LQLVLDTSVAVKWYASEDHTVESLQLAQDARQGSVRLLSPDILLPEFCHTLHKAVRAGVLPRGEVRTVLNAFRRVPIDLVPAAELVDEALHLTMLTGGAFYDALFVALAQREDADVVTADERMINAFAKIGRCVHVKDFKF